MLPPWAKIESVGPRVLASLGLALTACGQAATAEDCDRIVTRIAELELRAGGVTAPEAVALRIAETKAAFKSRAESQCVGKRLSEKSLKCIEQADTSLEILETCLN